MYEDLFEGGSWVGAFVKACEAADGLKSQGGV